jgi:BRCT domain type II-containing protein
VPAKRVTPSQKKATKKTARKPTAGKPTAKKAAARKTETTTKKPTVRKSAAKTPAKKVTARASAVRPGDLIVLDSAQVGSPAREGEVLQIIQGELSLSYRVRWADGRQTLISPMSGTARIIRASVKAR